MKRFFVLMIVGLFGTLFIFLAVMVPGFYLGFHRSSAGWVNGRERMVEETVTGEMLRAVRPDGSMDGARLSSSLDRLLPRSVSAAVYGADRQPVYIHDPPGPMGEGRGRHAAAEPSSLEPQPLKKDGKIIGYYAIGPVRFRTDALNSSFIGSMRRSVTISLLAAAAVALFFSFFFAKRVSGYTASVAGAIDRIAQGDLSVEIEERGPREIERIAESVKRLGKKLNREEKLRQQWAADIAHDLRTPLSALKSQLEGMSDGVLAPSRDRVERNLRELERIEILVNDLSELTRLESPEMRVQKGIVQGDVFVRELSERFAPDASGKGVDVTWEGDAKEFRGDENLLMRAASNFMTNAIRHTERGGSVNVRLTKDADTVVLKVSNTGERVPDDELERVFDRLYRGEYARKTPGSGLGLTIARKIAELHGGTVSIESTDKNGGGLTTVTMKIPAGPGV